MSGVLFEFAPPLGTPRDSCGFYPHEAPSLGVKPLSPLNNQSFAFSAQAIFSAHLRHCGHRCLEWLRVLNN